MLKPHSASSFCLPNKNRVGVAHGDGTNLEVVYYQEGEEGRGWLSAKVLRIALWEGEKREKCSKSRFVVVGIKKCAKGFGW